MIQQHNTKEKVTRTLSVDVESSTIPVTETETNESTDEETTQPPPPSQDQNEIHEPLE